MKVKLLTKSNPLMDAQNALQILKNSKQYCDDYIQLRREFFNKWQNIVFPTSITIDFFENIVYWLPRNDYLQATCKEIEKPSLTDYEKNFNGWLKTARTIK